MNRELKIGDWVIYISKEWSDEWETWYGVSLYRKSAKIVDMKKSKNFTKKDKEDYTTDCFKVKDENNYTVFRIKFKEDIMSKQDFESYIKENPDIECEKNTITAGDNAIIFYKDFIDSLKFKKWIKG